MIEVTDSPHSTTTFNRPGDDSFENYLLFILILSFGLQFFLLRSEDISNYLVYQLGLLFLVEEVTENSAGHPQNRERGGWLLFLEVWSHVLEEWLSQQVTGDNLFSNSLLCCPRVAYPGASVQLWVAAEAGLPGTSGAHPWPHRFKQDSWDLTGLLQPREPATWPVLLCIHLVFKEIKAQKDENFMDPVLNFPSSASPMHQPYAKTK